MIQSGWHSGKRRGLGVLLVTLALAACTTDGPDAPALAGVLAGAGRSEPDRARDATSQPLQVLRFVGVRPGWRVADVFSGGGYYSEILSHAVGPRGQVIAHNNGAYHGFAGSAIEQRYGDGRLANVEYVVSEADALGFPGDLDLIIMVMSFHDAYWVNPAQGWPAIDTERFNRQLFAALKSGGTLAIVDHAAVAGSGREAVSALHRIDEAFVVSELTRAGFTLDASSPLLRNADDDRTLLVFDPAIRRKTDRFILRFVKP